MGVVVLGKQERGGKKNEEDGERTNMRVCNPEDHNMSSEGPCEITVSPKSPWGKEGRINHSWLWSHIGQSYAHGASHIS